MRQVRDDDPVLQARTFEDHGLHPVWSASGALAEVPNMYSFVADRGDGCEFLSKRRCVAPRSHPALVERGGGMVILAPGLPLPPAKLVSARTDLPKSHKMHVGGLMASDAQRISDLLVQLWNTGDRDIAKQVYSEHAERTDSNGKRHGVNEIARYVEEIRAAYPDFMIENRELIAQGDLIASHWRTSGTQKGQYQGIPATGKRAELSGMTIYRLEDGKIVREIAYFDRLAILEQLGLAPATKVATAAS